MNVLFISDLDGTLLNPEAEISDHTAEIINSFTEKGLHFSFATARSERTAIEMTKNIRFTVPCVLMNGAVIYSINRHEYIRYHQISSKSSLEIARLYDKLNITGTMYIIKDNKLISHTNKNQRFCDILPEYDSECPIYFTANDEHDAIVSLRNHASEISDVDCTFYEDTYTKTWFLEIFSENASKRNAVKFLRESYGFDKVVCFGDNLNDISMFKESDIRVAVSNAKPELKQYADFTALSNDEDGVALWISQNFSDIVK